jgi:tetratricopeptide (TPR) repeat protein
MEHNSLEYIDQYFQGTPLPEEISAFERRITEEPEFAEDVAFYLSARRVLKEQLAEVKKTRFREIYAQNGTGHAVEKPIHKLWPYIAAAAMVAGFIFCWYLFIKPPSLQKSADNYITQNFGTLSVTMGTSEDNLQEGLRLYNEGQYKKALEVFEKLINLDNSNYIAKRNAGITSLRLQQYDKALHYFKLLANQPNLYANPGVFLQATTLLKRNLPGDKQSAKGLLEQVVQNDLDGKEMAERWLKKW